MVENDHCRRFLGVFAMRIRSGFRMGMTLAGAVLLTLTIGGPARAGQGPGRVFTGTPSALSAADIARLSANATQRSIIVFKDQLPGLPASGSTASKRVSAANADQQGIMSELGHLHAAHVRGFHVVNAIAATISAAESSRLEANPAVSAVVPDAMRPFASLGSGAGAASSSALPGNSPQ